MPVNGNHTKRSAPMVMGRQDHDPNYYRRQKAFADAQATGRRVDPEFDPWSRHSGK